MIYLDQLIDSRDAPLAPAVASLLVRSTARSCREVARLYWYAT
ncbi:MAG: hypothetical protein ACRDHZ_11425 [Ktedonobacteraceae bacterium]